MPPRRKAEAKRIVDRCYLPPHQVDTSRIDAGKAYALYQGMSKTDMGI